MSGAPNKSRKRSFNRDEGRSHKRQNSTKDEVRDMLQTIKEFTGKSTGTSGKGNTYREDRLVQLGAAPKKEQKIPLKIKVGLMLAKKKRSARQAQEARESQIQLPGQKIHRNSKHSSKKKR
mmetsp:Transcript_3588/g.5601  ORF Transcript_3588/g.5601 Transcript_3588/m.5601 type:complete len:121 (+) Transcript_3588:100-462(+)